jgi:glycolate oxidase FAD binding subunit
MSIVAAALTEGLGAIVGPAQVITNAEQLQAYGVPGWTPKAAIRPGTDQQVAEIVRFAASEKLTLVPTGARTKRAMHVPIGEFDLALDMGRLDRVVAYDPGDLTLSVEAGLPLGRLQAALAEHQQFLPLAAVFLERSTVGGTIASGIDSPLRQLYGTARDYVLGMEFVTGDGQVVKSGGRVVKNVSGYDLHKVMIGSLGSLGVITKVNFRTFPRPHSTRALLALFVSAREAVGMRHRIARSPLRPLTLEILSPQATELLFGDLAVPVPADRPSIGVPSKDRWALLVSFAGTAGVLRRYERDLLALAGTQEASLLDETTASALLARAEEFAPLALESCSLTVIIRMSVLPTEIAAALDDLAFAADKWELPWAAMARGVGVIDFALLPTAHPEARSHADRAVADVFTAVERREGSITIRWRGEQWREPVPVRKMNRNDLEQMRKIKDAFDPRRVFAPDPLAAWA